MSGEAGAVVGIASELAMLRRSFTYHPPRRQDEVVFYQEFRDVARQVGEFLVYATPASRERSLALTKLQEAVMWGNAAVALNGMRDPGTAL